MFNVFIYIPGLPKPAIITQAKGVGISKFFQLFDFMPSDILYTCTPLYHSAAGGLGLMNTLDQGEINKNHSVVGAEYS
jgi:hypothetical protein